jgi:hypothetical protein
MGEEIKEENVTGMERKQRLKGKLKLNQINAKGAKSCEGGKYHLQRGGGKIWFCEPMIQYKNPCSVSL